MKSKPRILTFEPGSLFAGLCILFCVLHCGQAYGKGPAGCEWECGDYHRLCPALNDSNYVKELEQEGVGEHLPEKALPQPYNCTNILFHYLCPLSCGACIPCSKRTLHAVFEEIEMLKQSVEDLEEIIDEGVPAPPKTTPAQTAATPATTLAPGASPQPTLAPGASPQPTPASPETTVPAPEPPSIPIVTAASALAYGDGADKWNADKALDKDPKTLFHSSDNKNAWAKFFIPSSNVKKVKILNRADCCGERMTGEEVWVCEGDECKKCGEFPAVGDGELGVLTCGGDDGIDGSYVKVVAPENYLQIADIEVLGEPQQEIKQVEIKDAKSSEVYSDKFPLKSSYDGDDSTFFHSKDPRVGWAKYKIVQSNVKLVRLQNRPDCCSERMTGNVVFVCADETDESCIQCGAIVDPIGKKQWAAVDCGEKEGLLGRIVKVAATNSYLQLTEVEIFADVVQPKVKLPIKGASSSPIYSDKFPLDKAFDEDEGTFFHAKDPKTGWAKFDIQPANVKNVRVQNRPDCCTDRILGNVVYVCADEGEASCSECGTIVKSVGKSGWAEVTCLNDGIDGNSVKIAATNSFLQVAEVEIFGTESDIFIETTPAPVTTTTTTEKPKGNKIQIIAGSAARTWSNDPEKWGVEKSLDEDAATIYHSKSKQNGWAKYFIPTSTVNTVQVLNRADCCGQRMTGEEVWVCDGDECKQCGKFPAVANGEWGTITCGGDDGIEGSYVKVVAPANYLQIAQVNIFGTIETQLQPAEIKDTSSSEIYSNAFTLDKSIDKSDETFFHAKHPKKGWAKYSIDHAKVRLVRLQNRPDCCADRMTGNVVYVCADKTDASCEECGAIVERVGKKQWTVVNCGGNEGIKGRVVKVAATNSYLQITEVEIYVEEALPTELLTIEDANSSEIYSDKFPLKNAYDEKDNTFFHAKDPKSGWARYEVKPAAINRVRVQNRPDCCPERMMGNVVYVCEDETDASCKECGTFVEQVGKKEWGEMPCGDSGGIKGRYVKVAATNSFLQITEIEIYGQYEGVTIPPITTRQQTTTIAVTPTTATPAPPETTIPVPEPPAIPIITAASALAYGNGADKWNVDKALDEYPKTLFHSSDNKNAWAKFFIPNSIVKKVKILNRADCCGERMTGEEVWVCEGDDCKKCGEFPAVGNGELGVMTCGGDEGIQGSYVKVVAPKNYLQIAEVEVLGESQKDLEEVNIKDAESSEIYSEKFPLKSSYDKDDKTFFHAKDKKAGWARYNIPKANVKIVRLQNRPDCCSERMTGNVVYVCSDKSDSSCKECGTVTEKVSQKQWTAVQCKDANGIQGHYVKVAATNSYLQLTEVEIYGSDISPEDQEPAEPEPTAVAIVTGAGSQCYANDGNRWGIERSMDEDARSIFHSSSNKNGWAKYYIPPSTVTLVKILNRADCCGQRMTGESVWVCEGEDCKKCGEFSAVANGEWGVMKCGGEEGIAGSNVKVIAPNNYLQIAKAEIYGTTEKRVAKTPIKSATSSTIYSNKFKLEYSYDQNDKTFFHAKDTKTGWAKYTIEKAFVRVVRLQNRPNCCSERMTGNVVYVCSGSSDSSCKECGRITYRVSQKQWAAIECNGGNGIQGSYVKVAATNSYLQLTEVEIYVNDFDQPDEPTEPEPTAVQIVAGVGSQCYANDGSRWGIGKSLDEDAKTIYHSSSNKNGWAKYYIPPSTVTLVKILNRADCCGQRMTGEEVWVCEAEDCKKCGEFPAVANGAWGTMKCGDEEGLQGSYIKVIAPANYLQIAKVEIYGATDKRVVKLPINDATSAAIYSNNFILAYSYDGKDGTFFHAKDSKAGWAKYGIKKSFVRLVRLQNRPDCCSERMTGNVVYVCKDNSDSSCKECGRVLERVSQKQWAAIECNGGNGIQGSYVKVQATNSYLQLTEVEIYANDFDQPDEPTEPEPKAVAIVTGVGSQCYANDGNRWGIERSLDQDAGSIFHSSSNKNGWAKYYIPPSTVTLVKILNRADCCGQRMTGESVWVCEGEDCKKCGEFPAVANGQWGIMKCGGDEGIQGSHVKVIAPNNYLQIAKAEIYGTTEKRVAKTPIKSATSSTIYSNNFKLEYSYDQNDKTFFHAKDTKAGWAKYTIQKAFVRVVRLQNRPNCCGERMTGNVVYVCSGSSDTSCKECGRITYRVSQKQWAAIECNGGNGIQGTYVKVAATNSYLQLTEVEIYVNDFAQPDEPTQPEPTAIAIVTGAGSQCYANNGNSWGIERSLDQDARSIFHSQANKNGWAKYYIPPSTVTQVKILNRADCCGQRMTGEEVWVCEGEKCEKCGDFPAVGNGQWGIMACGGSDGLQGSYVKVIAPSNYLQIAKAEIYGSTEKRVAKVQIQGATSAPIYSNNFILAYSYDGKDGTFFHAKDSKAGWAKYTIKKAFVRIVRLQNRPDCCSERMTGNVVYVCSGSSDSTCKECGRVTHRVSQRQWAAIECNGGNGLQGTYVKVAATNSYLQLTEVEIYVNDFDQPDEPTEPEPKALAIVTGVGSQCYANDGNRWGIERSLDQDAGSIFHSSSNKNGWAKYYIPPSTVTLVKILNRADCCGQRMTGESVWVCEGEDCKKCGEFPAVANGQWGIMKCGGDEGIQGSHVKVIAPNNYLQIAKAEVYGTTEKRVAKTPIKSATSSTIYSNNFKLEYSYDQNDKTFFHAKDTKTGWAKYTIQKAFVRVVRLQNRPNCCGERMTGNVVYVCSGSSDTSCKECGRITYRVSQKQWAAIECNGGNGIQGTYVKVAATNSYLQLTEVEIYVNDFNQPDEPTQPETTAIAIVTGAGSQCYANNGNSWGIERSLDQDARSIFHSQANKNGWAKYYIPPSTVTQVKILNRADCCGQRMTGESVWVCEGEKCEKCGEFPAVGNGQWGIMACGGNQGIQGSYIKVIAPSNYLQIAKAEVYGTTDKRVVQAVIKGSQCSPIYSNNFKLAYSYDQKDGTFFHAKDSRAGWAKYTIDKAFVRVVRLQNRPDCCSERMTGNVVYVCSGTSDSSCKECGRVTHRVSQKQWAAIECNGGNGIQGSYVKVAATNSYLQLTEVEIFVNAN